MNTEEAVEFIMCNGKRTLLDKSDLPRLRGHKPWTVGSPGYYYAAIMFGGKTIKIHRLVMDAPEGMSVDHINGDRLDNRKSNLRVCTHQQNCCNRGVTKTKTIKLKGVHYAKTGKMQKRWQARIRASGTEKCLGYFHTQEEAAIAYDRAAKEFHGEFASLNYVPEELTL